MDEPQSYSADAKEPDGYSAEYRGATGLFSCVEVPKTIELSLEGHRFIHLNVEGSKGFSAEWRETTGLYHRMSG